MKNINLKASLITPGNEVIYKITGVLDDDENYIYHEEDENKTKVIFNKKKNTLTRENKELFMEYTFKKGIVTKGKVHIKDLNKHLDLIIKTKEILIEEKLIDIKFSVENKDFSYTIEME